MTLIASMFSVCFIVEMKWKKREGECKIISVKGNSLILFLALPHLISIITHQLFFQPFH